MNKELYESKRLIEMENTPSARIPSYELAKELIRKALAENKQYPIEDWIICLRAEEISNDTDMFIPLELFRLVVSDINVIR